MTPPTRQLGRNGPLVTAIGLGMMSIGGAYGQKNTNEEKFALLDRAYAIGERFWDTADVYFDSEELIGEWFQRNPDKRKDIVLATKCGLSYNFETGEQFVDTSPEYVRKACEASLKKLKTNTVDLYYCHRVDGKTPIEETIHALVELKNEGKITHLGLSEVSATTLRRANAVHQIAAHQIEYNPFTLEPEADVIATARALGIATVAYSPMGRGFLTGQIKSLDDLPAMGFHRLTPKYNDPENFQRIMALVRKFEEVGRKHGKSPAQVCLAWLLRQGEDIVPIPGTRGVKYLEENTAAAELVLSDEEVRALREAADATVLPGLRYPAAWAEALNGDTPEL
ncbi:uncharacterized protein HMPREF1541_09812 [Cyphellophora europaea CBS 101466]|uniref:NADP-dependent oxidoreductase domain-containing protein n=1 Tax=Cyphellophora europaea (strain CBS 101466) TaxID=1220924 RepID=W2S8E7_CYPE1|nr:uncharacterized protein HMPREF1541_09812 [Cyphellophora europaea CBS 101466]ETN44937.1 hypothetical protein HMPREF1541_09812 [Cyphellophora europaea CBS 101466]